MELPEDRAGNGCPSQSAEYAPGLSRNHFQSLLHRGLSGLISGLEVKPAGRPRLSQAQKELREQAARLQRENDRLREQAETTDRLPNVARGLLTTRPGCREPRGVKRTGTPGSPAARFPRPEGGVTQPQEGRDL